MSARWGEELFTKLVEEQNFGNHQKWEHSIGIFGNKKKK